MNFSLKKLFYSILFFGLFLFIPSFGSAQIVLDCLVDDISVIDYPCVDNVKIVVDSDGLEPGALTFPKATMVRIHANIKDVVGIKYARVLIKDGAVVKALVSLYDDGKVNHGDSSSALNGSSGSNDNVYSALWQIPYSLSSSINYSLILEVAGQSGEIYQSELEDDLNSDDFEKTFFVDEVCVAGTHPCTDGDFGCSGGMQQLCKHDPVLNCEYWQNFNDCAPSLCCSGSCCGVGQICGAGGGCTTCDNTCDGGGCPDASCTGVDPDCAVGGCCGDAICNAGTECGFCFADCGVADCCGNLVCDNLIGENPINCLGECSDILPPDILFQIPLFPLNTFYNGDSFQVTALITDNFYSISSFPATYFRVIRDSDLMEIIGNSPLFDIGGNVYESASVDVDPTWQLGDYTVEITAMDTSGNLLTNTVVGDFTVSCVNECFTLGADVFCRPDNLFTQNCEVNLVTGCNIIVDNEDCTTYSNNPPDPNSIGICKLDIGFNPNCCEENCNFGDPSSCVSGTELSTCVQQNDGCFRLEANYNCPIELGDPNAFCRTDSFGDDGCCIDLCTLGDPDQCGATGIETCELQNNGCYSWQVLPINSCTLPETCHVGGAGPNCCEDEWPVEATNVDCNGLFDLRQSVLSPITGCIEMNTQEDCSIFNDPGVNPDGNGYCLNNDCCEENCDPSVWGGATGIVCNPVNSVNYLECADPDSNGCNTQQANTCAAGECRNGTMGDNCCSDLCSIGDPYTCLGAEVRRCEVNLITGCNHLVLQESCPATGKICYPGPAPAGAYCDFLDTTPPIITLQSQPTSSFNWVENNNTTFFSGGTYNNVNSLADRVELDLWSSGGTITVDNTWDLNTLVLLTDPIIDINFNAGDSVALKPVVVVPGYPAQGDYTAYVDGGAGPFYEWDTFAWQGTFSGATKFNIIVASSATVTPDFATPCIVNNVTGTSSIDITTCTNNNHKYLHYRVTLFSD
jgi:hypothetical protein